MNALKRNYSVKRLYFQDKDVREDVHRGFMHDGIT